MYDAGNGSVRELSADYAAGRDDPTGPHGQREYFLNMDWYCGFVYHELIQELLWSTSSYCPDHALPPVGPAFGERIKGVFAVESSVKEFAMEGSHDAAGILCPRRS